MVALSLQSVAPVVMVRESPTLPSLGQTTITPLGGGLYRIDSFFDVFTELSIDGGQNWIPSQGPTHVDLTNTPLPATWALFLSGVGLLAFLRRRKRQVAA
jgi:MYXO-CTERM domain-containing protein